MPDRQKISPRLALIVAFSLIVHVSILSLPLLTSEPEPATELRSITLVRTPAPEATPEAIVELPPPEPTAIAEPRTEDPEPQMPPAPAQPPLSTEAQSEIDIAEIRRQALEVAGQPAEEPEHDRQTPLYRSTPRLPGEGGWMTSYVGPVVASREQWQEIDGSVHSRTVLPNGQVICTSIRAPTVQEFFNPWMSAAVPMMRQCGRQRPEQSTDSDPWQRTASH